MLEDPSEALSSLVKDHNVELSAMLAGAAAFGSSLAVSTFLQQQLLRISTGTPAPLPSIIGMATVCAASVISHQAALGVADARHANAPLDQYPRYLRPRFQPLQQQQDVLTIGPVQIPMHTIRICCLGLLTFKCLGGRFWAIAPSSYTDVGSFARVSLPATSNYATASERAALERMGRRWGCHTCGSRMLFTTQRGARFVGDHMPPKSVAEQMNHVWWRRLFRIQVPFRFYAQCINCSNKQGSILSKATHQMREQKSSAMARSQFLVAAGGGTQAYNHGWIPRVSHLAGAVLGGVATWDKDNRKDGGQRNYKAWQRQAWEQVRGPWKAFRRASQKQLKTNLRHGS